MIRSHIQSANIYGVVLTLMNFFAGAQTSSRLFLINWITFPSLSKRLSRCCRRSVVVLLHEGRLVCRIEMFVALFRRINVDFSV
jgi:hypothetical protein